jgi:hypothetical protein
MQTSDLPLPPRCHWYKGRTFEPMSRAEAERWIASHNAWVETWNRHERDRGLPLSPDWSEAHRTQWQERSVLAFRPRNERRTGVIRLRGYQCFARGWSFCRRSAPSDIIWAGWWPDALR